MIRIAKVVEVATHRLEELGTAKKSKIIPEIGEFVYVKYNRYKVVSREYTYESEDSGEISLNLVTLIVEEVPNE